ncbi:hypothetical protein ACOSQ2_029622 [Xanthoceras sorbifolium]
MLVIWWRIWYRRNKKIHKHVDLSAEAMVPWSRAYLAAYRHSLQAPPNGSGDHRRDSQAIWTKPPVGCSSSTFASCHASAGVVGVGAIVRNEVGEVMLTAASKLPLSSSIACAGAHAILFGINIAFEAGLWPLEVESDCLNVVNLLT